MRLFLVIVSILLFSLQPCLAWGNKTVKPYVLLNSAKNTVYDGAPRIERSFFAGQRIYYRLVVPNGFKNEGIRVRVSEVSDKTSNWGITIIFSNDVFVNAAEKYYENYFVLHKSGRYFIEFFYLNNKNYPFARTDFTVD